MKKTLITLAMILVGLATQLSAMSMSNIRSNARFLSDRMAYELNLTPMQYDDCYEINFDFVYSINSIMDDVVYGYGDAIDRYYSMLDYRNEDLRFVLDAHQYARFLALEYFYRPIYTTGRNWAFRIHQIYTNHRHFYFAAPSIYHSYRGAHSHLHYHNDYYINRHHHPQIHHTPARIHGTPHFQEHGRRDFGEVRRERNQHFGGGNRPQGGAHRPQGGAPRPQSGANRPQGGARENRPQGGANRPQGNDSRREGMGNSPQSGNHSSGARSTRPERSSSRSERASSRPERSSSRGSGSRPQGGSTRGGGHDSNRSQQGSGHHVHRR